MADLSDKGSSESEDMNSQSSQTSQISSTTDVASPLATTPQTKTCVDCGTSKTPLWRGGPAGPKSLCNACGIKSRKKRRALLGLNKEDNKVKKTSKMVDGKGKSSSGESSSTSSEGEKSNGGRYGGSLMKKKLFGFGIGEVVALQRPRSNTTQRRKFGEVEQAAILLMSLSCDSVFA